MARTCFYQRRGEELDFYEDYAIALLNEVETPENIRRRFTVGY